MANPNKMNQEIEQRKMEARDDNLHTIKWCVLIMAANTLLWTNPWISWHGFIDFVDAVSRGSWGQGAFMLFYGLGILGIVIPAFQALKATKQLSAAPTNNRGQ